MTTPQKCSEDYDNPPIGITLEDLLEVVNDESELIVEHHVPLPADNAEKEGGHETSECGVKGVAQGGAAC